MEGDSRVRERSWAIRLLPWQIGKREASCTTATEMQCSAHRVVAILCSFPSILEILSRRQMQIARCLTAWQVIVNFGATFTPDQLIRKHFGALSAPQSSTHLKECVRSDRLKKIRGASLKRISPVSEEKMHFMAQTGCFRDTFFLRLN